MRKRLQNFMRPFFAVILTLLGGHAVSAEVISALSPGDVITQQSDSGKWRVLKILKVDTWPDGARTVHCLTYDDSQLKVDLDSLKSLNVRVWHAPIDEKGFLSGWSLVGNKKVSREELRGFLEYLKLTDFPRYVKESGIDVNMLVAEANEHYRRAIALGEAGDSSGAISEYGLAVDLFPLFYEAIDNRAFTYMDIGNYEAALQGFEDSLRVNPDGMTAYFSKGECLLRLGRMSEAEQIFSAGIAKFPEQAEMFRKYLELTRSAD